jgi:hypothetical protein
VSFVGPDGLERHTERGALLSDVLGKVGLATHPDRKNGALSFAVLAVGSDGYRAAVSYGEIAPKFGNEDVLIAFRQDGKHLKRPRLVVPGDVHGGRDVYDLVELRVIRLAPRQ